MTTLKIILLGLLGLVIGAAVLFGLLWYMTERNASKFDALGTVIGWQNMELPLFGRAIIQCSKRGKPMQIQGGMTLRSRKPKIGLKRMWTVSVYRTKDNSPVYVARRKRSA